MKNKSILVVFLLLVTCLVICCESVQASGPQDHKLDPIEVVGADVEIIAPIAQNDVQTPIVQPNQNNNYTPNFNPSQMVDTGLIDKYGLVGFVVLTCLGLVVFIVKQDRKTMNDLVGALKDNSVATMGLAEATRQLSKQVETDMKQMLANFNLRFDSIEKTIERTVDNDG